MVSHEDVHQYFCGWVLYNVERRKVNSVTRVFETLEHTHKMSYTQQMKQRNIFTAPLTAPTHWSKKLPRPSSRVRNARLKIVLPYFNFPHGPARVPFVGACAGSAPAARDGSQQLHTRRFG